MLILKRKKGDTIFVGGSVVTILGIGDQACKVGIAAPATTKVMRGEIVEGDQAQLIPPEEKRCRSMIGRLRSMSETRRQKIIAEIVKEFCGPQASVKS